MTQSPVVLRSVMGLLAVCLTVAGRPAPAAYGANSASAASQEIYTTFKDTMARARQAASAGRLEEAEQAVDSALQLMRDGAIEYGRTQWTPVWQQLRAEGVDKEALRRKLPDVVPYVLDSMPMGDIQAVRGDIAKARGEYVKFVALYGVAIRAMERTYRMLKLAQGLDGAAIEPYLNAVSGRAQQQYQAVLAVARDPAQSLQTRIFAARQIQQVADLSAFIPVNPSEDLQALHDQETSQEFQRYLKYLLRVSAKNNRETVHVQ